jgi:hypothetical protein
MIAIALHSTPFVPASYAKFEPELSQSLATFSACAAQEFKLDPTT